MLLINELNAPWQSQIIHNVVYERWAQQLVSDQSIPVATISYIFMRIYAYFNTLCIHLFITFTCCVLVRLYIDFKCRHSMHSPTANATASDLLCEIIIPCVLFCTAAVYML